MSTRTYIYTLFRKEVLLEVRQQYSFYGILLYVVSTVFVLYLAMGEPESKVWNGLFWMIQLFICINAVAKSFLQESRGRQLYYYSITHPVNFMLAKMLFNLLLMGVMTAISLILFLLLLGNNLSHPWRFLGISLLGGCSLSLVFSFLAAIAARAQQNAALMAIMGFPLIIPQLMLLMKLSNVAFADVLQGGLAYMVALILAFDLLVLVLAMILFPFLWKD